MIPFFSNWIVFVGSALTHINERIRLDGLRFIKLLCDAYPLLIAAYVKSVFYD